MHGMSDQLWAFNAYEAVRARLPGGRPAGAMRPAPDLSVAAEGYRAVLLDSFGVLNVGEQAIEGAPERLRSLRAAGKRILVVTNAAGYPKARLMERYRRLGFDLAPEEVISSRETLLAHLATLPSRHWGLIASERFGRAEFEDLDARFLADAPEAYAEVEGFLFFGAGEWTEARQDLLVAALKERPRPLLIGNPDIVAPVEGGLSREPGHYAHRIADATGVEPQFFGKPFPAIFAAALARLDAIAPQDALMVGDTLHTDILGAHAAGLGTALVTGHGSLRGENIALACSGAGIAPDWILERI